MMIDPVWYEPCPILVGDQILYDMNMVKYYTAYIPLYVQTLFLINLSSEISWYTMMEIVYMSMYMYVYYDM